MNSNEIQGLKQRAGIDLFRKYLPQLTQSGKEWTCPCPFDTHKSALFAVFPANDDPQTYLFKCHGCKQGGDIFKFLQWRDKVSFPEALKKVQQELGQSVEESPKFQFDQQASAARLPEILEFLASRGISETVAREDGVGVVDFPGVGPMVSVPYGTTAESGKPVVKLRAIKVSDRKSKFRHIHGAPSDDLLYGFAMLDSRDLFFDTDVIIVESELDALMLRSHGLNALSVSSATSSLDKGNLKYPAEVFRKLVDLFERIFIATDMDKSGKENALAWAKRLPPYKTFRIEWEYRGEDSGDPKDIGDLYAKDPVGFNDKLQQLKTEALNRPPAWRTKFHTIEELATGDLQFLITDIIPEGVTMLGSLSGVGKTWLALSMARALTTGKPFLGIWPVPKPVNVLYLCPEMGERSIRNRAEKMGIKERFYCTTMRDGAVPFDDPLLAMAVNELKPVVFLDTAIRFNTNPDENSAGVNSTGLAASIFSLINQGAPSIIGLHHSPKFSAEKDFMTLENVLRGTGDIGAMCDCVWGLQRDRGDMANPGQEYLEESEQLTRLYVKCVKPRDFEPPTPFRIQGKPYINEAGDFVVLNDNPYQAKVKKLIEEIERDTHASKEKLAKAVAISRNRIEEVAKEHGWEWKDKKAGWFRIPTAPVIPDLCTDRESF
jgi:hypothetical protein